MLIVPVRFDEQLVIDGDIKIRFERKLDKEGNPTKQVACLIDAPKDTPIIRREIKVSR